ASDAARGGSPDAAAAAAAALADGQRAAAALASRGSDRTVTFLEDSLIGDESPSRRSFVRKPTSTAPPRGTPKALAAPRNGLLSDECEEQEDVGGGDWAAGEDEAGFAKAPMNTTASTWLPASLDRGPLESPMETTQEEFFRSEMAAGSARATAEDMFRPETPILMFVDRASFPGHVDPDGHETLFQPSACDAATPQAAEPPPVITDEAWEAELLEWKRRYGCPDALAAVAAEAPTQAAAAAEQAPALLAAPPPEAAAPAAPCQQVEERCQLRGSSPCSPCAQRALRPPAGRRAAAAARWPRRTAPRRARSRLGPRRRRRRRSSSPCCRTRRRRRQPAPWCPLRGLDAGLGLRVRHLRRGVGRRRLAGAPLPVHGQGPGDSDHHRAEPPGPGGRVEEPVRGGRHGEERLLRRPAEAARAREGPAGSWSFVGAPGFAGEGLGQQLGPRRAARDHEAFLLRALRGLRAVPAPLG
ncbi:unnamed protein product, partial [Prorocentrum cordatum]